MPIPLLAIAAAAGGVSALSWSGILDSYEASAVKKLQSYYSSTYPNYPQNYGLSNFDLARIFGKYRYYVREKKIGYRDYKGIYAKIASDLGVTSDVKRRFILAALGDLDNITDESLIEYFKGGNVGSEKIAEKVGVVARSASQVIQAAESALPWYFKPQTVLVVAGLGAVVYILVTTGAARKIAGRMISKDRQYQQNPVKQSKAAKAAAAADRMYEIFHDRKPSKAKRIKRIEADSLAELGNALEIGYSSDKWTGKSQDYLHEFGKGVKLYATPDRKALIITGGKMSVESVGIVN